MRARVFGRRSSDSFLIFDRDTWCWRTCQLSVLGDSDVFSATWPRAGMTRNGTASRLAPLAPLTGGTGSGLWPTPVAHDDGKTPEAHMAMKQRMKGGPRNTITSLTVMVKAVERGMLPTPTANRRDGLQSHGVNVVTGSLNPTWVEWLMGFPTGWTDLEPSETPSSRRSPSGSASASSPTSKPKRPKRPKRSPDAMCVCGHPLSAHHGTGPCLVAVSGITGRDLDAKAKGSPSAPTNSICACSAYAPKP
jgi:hypothetical protein